MKRVKPSIFGVICGVVALTATACSGSGVAGGPGWQPRGNVSMIVPFAAGGGSDIAGRAMASGLESADSKVTVNVENRDGGSGAVGYSYFMGKRGDGNVLLSTENALVTLPQTGEVEFTYKDFTPIMKFAEDGALIVVDADSDYQDCPDVVQAAKKSKVNSGISGAHGIDDIILRKMERQENVDFERVPFESGGELKSALLGGQIELAVLNPGEVIGQLKSGDVRALCSATSERYDYPELKDIPTAKEEGINVEHTQFRGLLAPGDIPEEAQKYWIDTGKKAMNNPEMKKYISDNYLRKSVSTGPEFRKELDQVSSELEKLLGNS